MEGISNSQVTTRVCWYMSPCVSLSVTIAPATPGCLVIVALSPHYYSGHQHEDNPTLPTSGAPGLGKCSHQRKIQTFILQKYLTGGC